MNSANIKWIPWYRYKLMFYSLCLIGSLLSNSAYAHNTQQASFNVVLNGTESYIDLYLSQYGVEQALKASQPSSDSNDTDSTAFKQRLIKHIKDNTRLFVNGSTITYGMGMLKLGSHETRARLKLNNVPEVISEIEAKVTCFSNNTHQVNVLSITHNGTKKRYRLSDENKYEIAFSWAS